MSKIILQGLDPVFSNQTTTKLIIGTIPSVLSYNNKQYYSHHNSRFWKVMSRVLKFDHLTNYETRLPFIMSKGYGLWDVLKYAVVENKLSNGFKNCETNNLPDFLYSNRKIQMLIFNGELAKDLYHHAFGKPRINFVVLASTTVSKDSHYNSYETVLASWKSIP